MMPADEYRRIHDDVPLGGLYDFGHPQGGSRAADCPYAPQPGVGLSPAEIVGYLQTVPSLQSSAPQPFTVNGRTGLRTDIELAPTWTKPCSWSKGVPSAPILYANTGLSGVDRGMKERLIVLDIGHGDSVAIEIFSPDSRRFDALVGQAMPIVQSFTFAEP